MFFAGTAARGDAAAKRIMLIGQREGAARRTHGGGCLGELVAIVVGEGARDGSIFLLY